MKVLDKMNRAIPPQRCKSSYGAIADWHFVTEHAKDFPSGGGERDCTFALSAKKQRVGFVEPL